MAGPTRPLLPLAAVTAGLASGSALAAEWTWSPSADVLTLTQQNPGLAVDDKSKHDVSGGLAMTLGFGMLRRTERTSLSLTPVVSIHRYSGNSNFDRDEGQLTASYDWQQETISWTASANAGRDTTLTSELGTTGLTQGNLRHESWGASVGPTWNLSERWLLQSTLGTDASRYPDRQDSFSNYNYTTALVRSSYVMSEQLVVALYGTAGKLDAEGDGQTTDDKSANLELRYTWSPLTQLSASIGRSWVTSDAGSQPGLLYSVAASHAFEKSSLSFSVSRRQAPSGRALLTEADVATLAYAAQISERLTAGASATYSKRRNVLRAFDVDLQRVTYTRAELTLSWLMTPNWKLGLSAGQATQQFGSAFQSDELVGRGYNVNLGVSWNGDPYVW